MIIESSTLLTYMGNRQNKSSCWNKKFDDLSMNVLNVTGKDV